MDVNCGHVLTSKVLLPDVKCDCNSGYVGDGFSCAGNLLQVLQETPTFSNFLTVSHLPSSGAMTVSAPPAGSSRFHFLFCPLQQILNFSLVSEEGRRFVERLSDLKVQSTLFVPDNSGLPVNQVRSCWVMLFCVCICGGVSPVRLQTLTRRDIQFHLSEGGAVPSRQLKNGTRIRTRVGSLSVLGVADMLNPAALVRLRLRRPRQPSP